MAFCNNNAPCGHECGRQDDHGGSCDCYQNSCASSKRFGMGLSDGDVVPPAVQEIMKQEDEHAMSLLKGPFVRPSAPPDLKMIVFDTPAWQPEKNKILVSLARPSWDEIWMEFAERLSQRSTCRRLSVGCVVVSADNSAVLGMGYNGGPKGLNNECLSGEPGKCGHLHAEINALIKTNYRDAAFKRVYITTEPCYPCAVALVNANVGEVIYKHEYRSHEGVALLGQAKIPVRRFPPQGLSARDPYLDQDR